MKLGISILTLATTGILGFSAPVAQAGDWSVDVQIVAGQPMQRVWVEPVYEMRCERVWVQPVYETRIERVYHPAVTEERRERVWVPDRFEWRKVIVNECGQTIVRRQQVLVERGHWTEVCRTVVVREACYEDVARQVCVREGGWQNVEQRVCVREGYWSHAPAHRNLDVRVNRGEVTLQHERRSDHDADRFRRDRERDQQRYSDRRGESHARSDDRGDRYRR